MNPYLDQKRWNEVFSGFEIVDVAIRDRSILQLCSRRKMSYEDASHLWDHDIPTRIMSVFLQMPPGENCGFQELTGMKLPVLGVSRTPFPTPQGMISAKNRDGDTWPVGGGRSGPMEKIAPGAWPHPHRLKCVDGFTYAIGPSRAIYKRIAEAEWVAFRAGLPESHGDIWPGYDGLSTARQLELGASIGFNDLDGFSDADMYAVGGHGDVWHFNGQAWQQIGFPSNVALATVTCGGDGNVYISGQGGSLWVGRHSSRMKVHSGDSSVPWNDVVWFQDQLWLASDYQFRIWDGRRMRAVEHHGRQVFINGHLDAYDGLLAIASFQVVMTFDGREWQVVIAPYASG